MIKYFVEPYNDETHYSIVARYQRNRHLRDDKVLMELFGSATQKLNYIYPHRLNYFIDQIRGALHIEGNDFLRQHSLAPLFYLNNIFQAKPDDLINTVGSDRRTRFLSRRCLLNELKYCPKCALEDFDKHGESYWHRSHNLPGISVCASHNLILQPYSPPEQKLLHSAFPKDLIKNVRNVVNRNNTRLKVSQHYVNLLSSANVEQAAIMEAALLKGLIHRRGHQLMIDPKLRSKVVRMLKYFDSGVDKYIQMALREQSLKRRIVTLHSPVLYIIFDYILKSSLKSLD